MILWMRALRLSEPECAVMTLTARGRSVQQIADELGMPDRTVRWHRDQAREKLRAPDKTAAAVRHGERYVRHAEGCPLVVRRPRRVAGQLEAGLVP